MLEREAARNIGVMWLLKKLTPDFKTIADFRKDNLDAVKAVCREFTLLCKHLDLFGGEIVAIDGSKFRAVNSRKRNFNRASPARLIRRIDVKTVAYRAELERQDKREPAAGRPTAAELRAAIDRLKGRRESYGAPAAKMAEDGAESVELVADEGYYSGEEIKKCEDEGIVTYLPKARVSPELKKELFTKDDFRYEPLTDTYTSPGGAKLNHRFTTPERDGVRQRYYRTSA